MQALFKPLHPQATELHDLTERRVRYCRAWSVGLRERRIARRV